MSNEETLSAVNETAQDVKESMVAGASAPDVPQEIPFVQLSLHLEIVKSMGVIGAAASSAGKLAMEQLNTLQPNSPVYAEILAAMQAAFPHMARLDTLNRMLEAAVVNVPLSSLEGIEVTLPEV